MASTSSGASSSTTTPSPTASKGHHKIGHNKGSTDKLPSTSLMACKENDLTSSNDVDTEDDLHMSSSLSSAWVDDIRFSSYRLAAKLRLLQQRTGLAMLDVWNVIEAFRENGLSAVEQEMSLSKPKLEALLSSMYGDLAKRLPPPNSGSSAVPSPSDLQAMASWLFSWLFTALKPAGSTNIKVRTLKTAMSTLCSGKLLDKLRYLFSQLADPNGHMIPERFAAFIRDVGRIASAVGEQRQQEQENTATIFDMHAAGDKPVTVNDFIETLMSDPGPACLSWLPLLHRISNAESVIHHGLRCASCRAEHFRGLRYKSDRSSNYHLCQACFWCGNIATEHKNDVFKEYNSFKPSSSSGGHSRSTTPLSSVSLKKSMPCLQGGGGKKATKKVPKYPEHPEKPMDLSSMIPATSVSSSAAAASFMMQSHNNFPPASSSARSASSASNPISDQQHQQYFGDYDDPNMAYPEDEHQLIAAYAHQLATASPEAYYAAGEGVAGNEAELMSAHSKHLVRELERKNREIMRDIHQLKHAHRNRSERIMQMPSSGRADTDPSIVTELEDLRHHKADLENRLGELQTARRDLMIELDELMKLLKVNNQVAYNTMDHQASSMLSNNQTGPMVIVSPATANHHPAGGGGRRFDDVTDVSGLGIDHGPRKMMRGVVANEDSVNSGSD